MPHYPTLVRWRLGPSLRGLRRHSGALSSGLTLRGKIEPGGFLSGERASGDAFGVMGRCVCSVCFYRHTSDRRRTQSSGGALVSVSFEYKNTLSIIDGNIFGNIVWSLSC